ncbi:helix-turn-helix domain-containing protein [Salinibacterium sp. PAMC 21357]|uniref:helix-turn-helix domain-containing protein n=1 Tax=Salinibacterium sp. PAMC 21357 TaxID=1112215 RepID=UPI0002889032|nr:helix-turn-helix transcriptional regulator [Salinibacterium sp. PAMC 21357]
MTNDESAAVPAWVAAVGTRIRELRQRTGWTVQQLADNAGVSRRMLTLIELGQANPSLTTVDRIATALGTDFPGLALAVTPVDGSPGDGSAAELTQPARVWQDDAGSAAELLGASSTRPRSELWRWTLTAGHGYESAPDADATEAVIHVLSGTLSVSDSASAIDVPSGATTVFRALGAYSYRNEGDAEVQFVRLFRSL